MTQLPDLMTAPRLTISIDSEDMAKFRLDGSTYIHRDRLASIPGSRYVGAGRNYWTIPKAWTSLKVASRLFSNCLDWSPEAVEWANSIWNGLIEPSLSLRTEGAKPEWVEAVAKTLPEGIDPKGYQVAGAIYLATAKRAMLFDVQGTGKMTQTALTLSLYPDLYPVLIISPKNAVRTWKRELAKFGIESVAVDGSKAQRDKQFAEWDKGECKVLIISYGLMSKYSRVSGFGTIKLLDDHKRHKELNQVAWTTVVSDECHRISDPTAIQTRACWAVRDHAQYVWGLTGTPVESDLVEFWALLHFIDPVSWPSKSKYIDLWINIRKNWFGGMEVVGLNAETAHEFYELTDWCWRRQLKSDELPPVIEDTRYCEMPATHRKAYNDMKKQLMAELGTDDLETLFAPNHMVKASRLKSMAASRCEVGETTTDDEGVIHQKIRMIEPSWKLDAVEDAMQDYPFPAIFWFDNRDLLHMFETRLDKKQIEYVSVHGGIAGQQRDDNVLAFQAGKVQNILCTYGAAAEAITLTAARVRHRVQRPYSSIKDEQAPFRNERIGSEIHDSIIQVDYYTEDTIEPEWAERLNQKGDSKQELLRDGQ